VFIVDTKTLQITDCNQKAIELYGIPKDKFIGQSPMVFSAEIQVDNRPTIEHIQEHMTIVQQKGFCFAENWMSKRADDTIFYSEISITAFPAPNENLYIVQIRDITEKLRAQRAIIESEARFRSLFENGRRYCQ